MDTDFVKNILKNKESANDFVHKYNVTPDIDDNGWNEAIYEARSYGIPQASFSDTSDKKVITPKHLGYDKFNYHWKTTWTSEECWEADDDEIIKANTELLSFAKIMHDSGYKIYIVHPCGWGDGALDTRLFTVNNYENQWTCGDLVLFVYEL